MYLLKAVFCTLLRFIMPILINSLPLALSAEAQRIAACNTILEAPSHDLTSFEQVLHMKGATLSDLNHIAMPSPKNVVSFVYRDKEGNRDLLIGRILKLFLSSNSGALKILFKQEFESSLFSPGTIEISLEAIVVQSFQDDAKRRRAMVVLREAQKQGKAVRFRTLYQDDDRTLKQGFIDRFFDQSTDLRFYLRENTVRGGSMWQLRWVDLASLEILEVRPRTLSETQTENLIRLKRAHDENTPVGFLFKTESQGLNFVYGTIKDLRLGTDGRYTVHYESQVGDGTSLLEEVIPNSVRFDHRNGDHPALPILPIIYEALQKKLGVLFALGSPAHTRQGRVHELKQTGSGTLTLALERDDGEIENISLSEIYPQFLYTFPVEPVALPLSSKTTYDVFKEIKKDNRSVTISIKNGNREKQYSGNVDLRTGVDGIPRLILQGGPSRSVFSFADPHFVHFVRILFKQ